MRRIQDLSEGHGARVVAFGGGHGLSASLRALRRVTDNLTAVVGVSDNGGSSGRLRQEFGVVPPGDLRMALAALCGDDTWGRTWSRVIQHRFSGTGELDGHSLGNLLIMSMWEETGDVVAGLDWVAALLGAQGRVLPVSTVPLEIVAEVRSDDPNVEGPVEVRGQVQVATTPGEVERISVDPASPPACPEAVDAISEADLIVLGPGSWYTSVMAPLLVPGVKEAVANASARLAVVLNLVPQTGETPDFTPEHYLEVLNQQVPDLGITDVIVDPGSFRSTAGLKSACSRIGAQVMLRRLTPPGGRHSGTHDPDLLAAAFAEIAGRGRIVAWR
jgi:uncharacterized cofD-like protein